MKVIRPENEEKRLQALDLLEIVDSERLPEYDAVVETAALLLDCPISLVSLVDKDRQWFKAKCGLDADETARDVSFCQHALLSNDVFVVNDALKDDRFSSTPLVAGDPKIRFYAGYPLSIDGEHILGTLCVIDHKPRYPDNAQLHQLKRLGKIVEGLLKSHKATVETKTTRALADTEHNNAVRDSELLEEVANISGVGGWELCLKTQTLTWTNKAREIHEVPSDYQPTVDLALAFYPSESRKKISEAIDTAVSDKTGWDLELPFITAKGRNIWVRAAGRPVTENGEVTRLIGAFQDITDRKLAADSVRYSEVIQRTTLQSLSEGIMMLSRSGEIQSINSAGAALLGHDTQELVGTNVRDLNVDLLFDGRDKKGSGALLLTAASHPFLVQDIVTYVVRKGAKEGFWLRVNASPLDANNAYGLDGVVVSLKDVTAARQNEEALKAVFNNFPGGIIYRDKDMRLVECNKVFQEMFGYPDELIEKKASRNEFMRFLAERGDFGPGDPDELVAARSNTWELTEPTQTERILSDGRALDARSTPLPDGGVVYTFFDITERIKTEQSVRQSEAVQRTILEALREGILLLTPNGEIQSANPAAAELFGYTVETIIGMNVNDFEVDMTCELDGGTVFDDPLALAARDPLVMHDVLAQMTPKGGGQRVSLRINARPIDENHEMGFEGIVVSVTDITKAKQQADTLQVIFDNFPGGVAHFDENFQLASCNEEYGRLLGYPRELIDQKLHILDYLKFTADMGDYGPGDPETLALAKFKSIMEQDHFTSERGATDGKFLEIRNTPLPTGGAIFNFFDVTARKNMEKELAESELLARHRLEELETILGNMRQGVSVFDGNGHLTMWNQQYIDIFEKPPSEIYKGVSLVELIEAEKRRGEFEGDVTEHVLDLLLRLSSGEIVRSKFTHQNGKIISVVHTPLPGGGWIGTHEDITLREQAAARITHAAHHDDLTGLANRALFNATLEETLTVSQIQGSISNLMLIDLDRFKPVNDTYGHDVGDELLKEVAKRIKDCIRSSDLVARLGGDEFSVILRGIGANPERTSEIADRIVKSIREPFNVFGHRIEIGASIGITEINEDSVELASVIKEADVALYEVKRTGRNGFRFYSQVPNLRAV